MHSFLQDVRYAARSLRNAPGFTAIALITLALGIGLNTAIFDVVNTVLFKPLPYPEPGRLVAMWEHDSRQTSTEHGAVSGANFSDWKAQTRSFEAIAAYFAWNYNLTGIDEPTRLRAMVVSGEFFRVMGVPAQLGRAIGPADDEAGHDDAVVLSHRFWQGRFAADPRIVGRSITLNGRPHTVLGVMPATFRFPDDEVDIWRPMAMSPRDVANRDGRWLRVVGRLRPGVRPADAASEMQLIARRLALQYPRSNAGTAIEVTPLRDDMTASVRQFLVLLLVAVGFVPLIACVNIANLLLARASSRRQEMAVRVALGAPRRRLISQVAAESLLVAFAGGALGLLLAAWGTDLLIAVSPTEIPRVSEIALDGRVLAFVVLSCALATLVFGAAPAWQVSRASLITDFNNEIRATAGTGARRFHSMLVVAEVAITVVLLVGAGLATKSFMQLIAVRPGFNPEKLLTLDVTLPPARYPGNAQQAAFFHRALEEVRGVPGVVSAAAVQDIPFRANSMSFPFVLRDRPSAPGTAPQMVGYRAVAGDYFQTLTIPLVAGRAFTSADDQSAPPVVIVNQTFARRYFPDGDAVGHTLRFGEPNDPDCKIVGVAADIRHMGLAADEGPVLYQPHAQKSLAWLRWMTIVVRTTGDPLSTASAVRQRVHEVDRDQPVYNVATMEQWEGKSVSQPRFTALLLVAFASLALVLTALGIYGVVSYTTRQRTREIGIRIALGAQLQHTLALVMAEGMKTVLAGLLVGLAGARALTSLMTGLLFGVSVADFSAFAAGAALLAAVAALACYLPARRAANLDPVVALRHN